MSSNTQWLIGLVILIAVATMLGRPSKSPEAPPAPSASRTASSPGASPAATSPADSGAIVGTVVDAVSHKPVSGAQVTILSGQKGTATTDGAGRFSLGPLAPGLYSVMAQADDYQTTFSAEKGFGETLDAMVAKGETREVGTIPLTRGAQLTVGLENLPLNGTWQLVLDPPKPGADAKGRGRQFGIVPDGQRELRMPNAPAGPWLVGIARFDEKKPLETGRTWYYPGTWNATEAQPVELVFKRPKTITLTVPADF